MCLEITAARERVVGVALSLLRLTLRDRHPRTRGQRHHQPPAGRCLQGLNGLVGHASGRDQIPARQCGLRIEGARRRPMHGQDTPVLPGRLARAPRRRNVADGQGHDSQRHVAEARGKPAQLVGCLDGRLSGGPGRIRLTLVSQHDALEREASRLVEHIVSRVGLGNQLGELRIEAHQIALTKLCKCEVPATPPRAEPVSDRLGEVTSFFAGRARRDRRTRQGRRARLPAEDQSEPPPVAQCPGQPDRLGEACPGHLDVVAHAGAKPTGGQCSSQQGRVVGLAREGQGLLGLFHAAGSACKGGQHRPVGERSRAHRVRHLAPLRVIVGERGLEPGQPFPEAALLPQWLQRGCQRQRQLGFGVFPAPSERGAQVVDLDVGMLHVPLIITARRRVEQGRQRRVVVAVARSHNVGFTGFAELFQGVLAHSLQQPVPRAAFGVVGHYQGFVDQQRE